mmetsp:Transcript_59228/g.105230  ORF Transcript_59228/g.105230 Transcript_59228/m.105230 type:complete len:256 (-) Transcript_59228:3428-4195(-)
MSCDQRSITSIRFVALACVPTVPAVPGGFEPWRDVAADMLPCNAPAEQTSSFGGVYMATSRVWGTMAFNDSSRRLAAPEDIFATAFLDDFLMSESVPDIVAMSSSSQLGLRSNVAVAFIASFSSFTRKRIHSSMRANASSYCFRISAKREYVHAATARVRRARPSRSAHMAGPNSSQCCICNGSASWCESSASSSSTGESPLARRLSLMSGIPDGAAEAMRSADPSSHCAMSSNSDNRSGSATEALSNLSSATCV